MVFKRIFYILIKYLYVSDFSILKFINLLFKVKNDFQICLCFSKVGITVLLFY